jgi:hypothetical protein
MSCCFFVCFWYVFVVLQVLTMFLPTVCSGSRVFSMFQTVTMNFAASNSERPGLYHALCGGSDVRSQRPRCGGASPERIGRKLPEVGPLDRTTLSFLSCGKANGKP